MNKTILHGKLRRVRGNVKTTLARLTDDDRRMLDGKIDQMVGLFEERYGYTRQEASHVLAHYLSGYGKKRRKRTVRRANFRRAMFTTVGLFGLTAAGWIMFKRLLPAHDETKNKEFASQESFAGAEVQFE